MFQGYLFRHIAISNHIKEFVLLSTCIENFGKRSNNFVTSNLNEIVCYHWLLCYCLIYDFAKLPSFT